MSRAAPFRISSVRAAFAILTAAVAVVTAAVAVVSTGQASAAVRGESGLHNQRYCEIIEVKGALPDVVVTVWNTIGLNRCPAVQWNAFDESALATELGDIAVILNGPRHWVIDSASGSTGEVRSFHGMRLRKVATIPIRTADDLIRAPYTERVVSRHTTWSWKRGRRVYELVAPGGARYVMQSYSQIVDPNQKISQLPSLGDRLTLSPGWQFQTRRLRQDFDLTATGKARIVQDDLQNTYQREPRPQSEPVRHRVSITGAIKTVGSPAPGTLEDRGTISGPPFGNGSVSLQVTFEGSRVTGSFRIGTPRGSASGTVSMGFTISGSEITFSGTADFTDGTGVYRRIAGENLKAYDHNQLDGQSGTLSLDGHVTY